MGTGTVWHGCMSVYESANMSWCSLIYIVLVSVANFLVIKYLTHHHRVTPSINKHFWYQKGWELWDLFAFLFLTKPQSFPRDFSGKWWDTRDVLVLTEDLKQMISLCSIITEAANG